MSSIDFGVVDNRFLARSIGLLNPPIPFTVSEDAPVRRALEILQENKIGCVVVVDVDGRISGMFSERDVVLRVVLADIDPNETLISKIMTPKPHVATMTTTVAFALNMMSHGGFRHIPIVDDDNFPVGMISVKNIVDFIVQALTKDLTRA